MRTDRSRREEPIHHAQPVIDVLRRVPLLRGLSDTELRKLERLVEQVTLERGYVLAREGGVARQAFLIVKGEADVFVDGKQIAKLGPGEFVGEIAMLDQRPRSATVR